MYSPFGEQTDTASAVLSAQLGNVRWMQTCLLPLTHEPSVIVKQGTDASQVITKI